MSVVHDGRDAEKTIYVQEFVEDPDAATNAKCLGYVSSFYGNPEYQGTCLIPPHGNGWFLNGTHDESRDASQMWTIRSSGEFSGSFEIVAANKPAGCSRFLGVEDCSQAVLVEKSATYFTASSKYTQWKLIKRYDIVARPAPAPGPSSPPKSPSVPGWLPPPSDTIPGPTISAPSSTSTGIVNVVVDSLGGSNGCFVASILITSTPSSVDSIPGTTEVPAWRPGLSTAGVPVVLSATGYNSIYAVGRCSGGLDTTERSNGLSVFYGGSGTPVVPQVGGSVLFSLRYNGLDVASFDASDELQVCENIDKVQPGSEGCRILSKLPGSVVVTGTTEYPSSQAALNLVGDLEDIGLALKQRGIVIHQRI